MFDYSLDIIGSEWIIIILVALGLILGTNQLPNTARQFGRAISEFNKAKNELQGQMKSMTNQNLEDLRTSRNRKTETRNDCKATWDKCFRKI